MNFLPLKLKDILPFVAPFSVLCGMITTSTYYSYFQFDIVEYITISELLHRAVWALSWILMVFLVNRGASFFLNNTIDQSEDHENEFRFYYSSMKEKPRKLFFLCLLHRWEWFVFFLIAWLIGLYFKHFLNSPIFFEIGIHFFPALFWLLISITTYLEIKKIKETGRNFNKESVFLIYFMGLLIITIYFKGRVNGYQVKNNYKNVGTVIQLTDNTLLTSDSSKYYIGETDGYVFIYDAKNETTDVLNRSVVKRITMPPKVKIKPKSHQ